MWTQRHSCARAKSNRLLTSNEPVEAGSVCKHNRGSRRSLRLLKQVRSNGRSLLDARRSPSDGLPEASGENNSVSVAHSWSSSLWLRHKEGWWSGVWWKSSMQWSLRRSPRGSPTGSMRGALPTQGRQTGLCQRLSDY